MADDGEQLLVGVLIDERRVHHDERVVVRPERPGVEDGAVDDEHLRHRDLQRVAGRLGDPVDPRELTIADLHGVT
jgi:hypothetical protein